MYIITILLMLVFGGFQNCFSKEFASNKKIESYEEISNPLSPFDYPEVNVQKNKNVSLSLPIIETCLPTAGKRTYVYMDDYPNAPYVLFLPYNFCEERKWPVIVELLCSSHNPKCAVLGYGLTKGMNCIWITVPYIDENGNPSGWFHTPSTANLWLAALDDLNKKFNIDTEKVVIAGFSLGAMAVSGIGNWDDNISSKWAGYFAHAHFDGCCYRQAGDYKERLNRFKNRKVFITVGGQDPAIHCSLKCYKRLLEKGILVDFMEIPNAIHSPLWILEDSEYAEYAREWVNSIILK